MNSWSFGQLPKRELVGIKPLRRCISEASESSEWDRKDWKDNQWTFLSDAHSRQLFSQNSSHHNSAQLAISHHSSSIHR
jgi:hypothetical protein